MKHLLLDANNLLFRARHACARRSYDNVIIHTFFRSLKPIIARFEPDYAYFVLDGYPKKRMEMQPEYKGTRKYHDKDGFRAQRKEAIKMIKESVPFVTIRHPETEADDVIADLALRCIPQDHEKVIVSSDTDFIQLCQDASNTTLYNPIKKDFREPPEYPYAQWKALRGDAADNISGIRGIGNKRAAALLEGSNLEQFFIKKPEAKEKYQENLAMICLKALDDNEREGVEFSFPKDSISALRETFTSLKFKSMITDKAWGNYSSPFMELKDGRKYIT